jgi:hypothetical protein
LKTFISETFFMNLNGHCGFNGWFSHWFLFLLQFC